MLSKKGETLNFVNDFKFGYHKNDSNRDIRRKCTNKNCRASVRIYIQNKIKASVSNLIHIHEKLEVKILNR
jgi:hypothetical protein